MGLTITNVINAYKKSKLKPKRNCWLSDDKKCGCGMTALYISQHKVCPSVRAEKECLLADDIIERWSNEKYGCEFSDGFVCGFDDFAGNEEPIDYDSVEYRRGYWIGRKSFKELKKRYKISE